LCRVEETLMDREWGRDIPRVKISLHNEESLSGQGKYTKLVFI
jgi:hypothetical protein